MKILAIGVVLLLALGYGGAKFYLYYNTSKGMKSAVLAVSPVMDLKYGGISSSFGGELTIDDLRIKIKGFEDDILIKRFGLKTPSILTLLELGKLASGDSANRGKMPEHFGIFAEEIRVPIHADYYKKLFAETLKAARARDHQEPGVECVGKYGIFSPRALKAMNYEEQVVSVSMIVRQADSEFVIDMDTSAEQMFDTKISVALGGHLMSELSRGRAYRPKLSKLRIEHTDKSLIGRVKKYCAELGLTPQQTLDSHLDALRHFGKQNGIEFDEYVTRPYREYLAGSPNLVITASPRRLIDFKEISHYNPRDVPALLNLEAVAQ